MFSKKCQGLKRDLQNPEYRDYVLKIKEMGDLKVTKSTKRYVDNSKVTDHYAIIPTYVNAETVRMDENTKNVYNLIVKRFLAIFFPRRYTIRSGWRRW